MTLQDTSSSIHTGDLLRKLADGQVPTQAEAAHLLSLTSADDLRRLGELVPPAEAVSFLPQVSLFLTNRCEMRPSIHGYPVEPDSKRAFTLTIDDIDARLEKARIRNIRQVLLSGGFWPELVIPGLEAPTLLKSLTRLLGYIAERYEGMQAWGFSPDEIDFLSIVTDRSHRYLLERFMDYGLRGLSGQGADILDDGVRKKISSKKASVKTWLEIASQAAQLGLPMTASMTYGHYESVQERAGHLLLLRELGQRYPRLLRLFELLPVPRQSDLAPLHGWKPLTLAERQNQQLVSALLLKDVCPALQTQWFLNGRETQPIVDEALEGLDLGANHLGMTDVLSALTFRSGESDGGLENSFTAAEMAGWLTAASRQPVPQATLFEVE